MGLAIEEAKKAYKIGEVPIGAIVVVDDKVVAAGHDFREFLNDASAHAEMLVMREAAQKLGDWRLNNATMYVTVEPCAMCAGAIVQYRLGRLVYGAPNSKSGSIDSILSIVKESRFNHQVEVISGVLEDECKKIIRLFFKGLRKKPNI
jgi:tRNA(adenine34) deaminase